MKTKSAFLLIILLATTCLAAVDDAIVVGGIDDLGPYRGDSDYPVSLALSGGGARGFSVIGILKAFEEKGIAVRAITGTSMGGIIGGLYAAGYTPDQLDSIATQINFNELFSNAPARRSMLVTRRQEHDRHLLSVRFDGLRPVIPQALTAGQKLTELMTNLTTRANYQSGANFSRLPIPFKTISTDIVSGREVVLDTGSIADALRATMAFPLAFTGLEKENQVLMDGGMVTPIPVELVRGMSNPAGLVIAINTASKLLPKEELVTPVDIANQVTSIMTADQLKAELAKADYVIEPPIDDFASSDFEYKDSIIALGYRCGLEQADSIIAIIERGRETITYDIEVVEVVDLPQGVSEAIRESLLGRVITRGELTKQLRRMVSEFNLFRLQADIEPVQQPTNGSVGAALVIMAYENLTIPETEISFAGNSIFDEQRLIRELLAPDSVITPRSVRQGLERILALYHDEGYDLANIRSVAIDKDNRRIGITIDEAVIRRIDVEHNKRTRDWYIRSYFTLKIGEPYSTSRASTGITNIYGTDLFDRVTVGVLPSPEGAVVKIGVDERKNSQLRLGWHWDDEYESEEFAEFLDDNIGGIGLQYLLHARYSPRRQEYLGTFKADRIVSTYLTSRLNLFHRYIDRRVYVGDEQVGTREERKTGFELTVGQQIARLGTVSAGLTMERVEYENSNTGTGRVFDLRVVTFESMVENFDRLPFPSTGNRYLFQLQLAGKYLGGEEEFTRFYSSLEIFLPLGKFLNYHPSFQLGVSRSGLPPSEQFFLGGMHSFAGFRTHQLAGDKMFIFSNEIRVKLPLRLYLTGRHDLGEVYVSSDEIKLRNLRNGVGVCLAFDSPLGPFEFGYGIADSDFDRFYVNIGFAF
ncbi:MAG: patatin-like phospholipase family protein [Candidatus Zixiibacteriota bacterium]